MKLINSKHPNQLLLYDEEWLKEVKAEFNDDDLVLITDEDLEVFKEMLKSAEQLAFTFEKEK